MYLRDLGVWWPPWLSGPCADSFSAGTDTSTGPRSSESIESLGLRFEEEEEEGKYTVGIDSRGVLIKQLRQVSRFILQTAAVEGAKKNLAAILFSSGYVPSVVGLPPRPKFLSVEVNPPRSRHHLFACGCVRKGGSRVLFVQAQQHTSSLDWINQINPPTIRFITNQQPEDRMLC